MSLVSQLISHLSVYSNLRTWTSIRSKVNYQDSSLLPKYFNEHFGSGAKYLDWVMLYLPLENYWYIEVTRIFSSEA